MWLYIGKASLCRNIRKRFLGSTREPECFHVFLCPGSLESPFIRQLNMLKIHVSNVILDRHQEDIFHYLGDLMAKYLYAQ